MKKLLGLLTALLVLVGLLLVACGRNSAKEPEVAVPKY